MKDTASSYQEFKTTSTKSWKDEPVKNVIYKKTEVKPFEYNRKPLSINYLEKIKIAAL